MVERKTSFIGFELITWKSTSGQWSINKGWIMMSEGYVIEKQSPIKSKTLSLSKLLVDHYLDFQIDDDFPLNSDHKVTESSQTLAKLKNKTIKIFIISNKYGKLIFILNLVCRLANWQVFFFARIRSWKRMFAERKSAWVAAVLHQTRIRSATYWRQLQCALWSTERSVFLRDFFERSWKLYKIPRISNFFGNQAFDVPSYRSNPSP